MTELTEAKKFITRAFNADDATIAMMKWIAEMPKDVQEKIDENWRKGFEKGRTIREREKN